MTPSNAQEMEQGVQGDMATHLFAVRPHLLAVRGRNGETVHVQGKTDGPGASRL